MSEENQFEPDEQQPASEAEPWPEEELNTAPVLSRGPGRRPGGGTRALAEGAMMTALTLILAVISLYVPVLNMLAQFLFPAPLALLVLRHGFKFGCIGAASVFLLSAMLLGLPHAVYLFILYGFLGLFFGWCFRAGKKANFTLLGGVLIAASACLLMLIFPTYILGISLDQFQEMFSQTYYEYARITAQQGGVLPGGRSVESFAEYMTAMTMQLLPGSLLVVAMILTLVCYMLLGRLLRRMDYDIPKLPPFREWRLDWRFLWLLIVALAASSLSERLQAELLTRITNNLLSVFVIIFTVYGFSVLNWICWRFKISAFVQVLAVLLALQLFSGLVLIMTGVFDPLFDFRRRLEVYVQKRQR